MLNRIAWRRIIDLLCDVLYVVLCCVVLCLSTNLLFFHLTPHYYYYYYYYYYPIPLLFNYSIIQFQVVLDNPTCFTNPFQFEITFECLQELDDDLEWKVLYVGSAQDAAKDQILDEILVGPVPVGVNKFVLQADAPDPSQLTQDDLLGVTVVLVTCSYKEREFVRVGYYVNNEYHDPNAKLNANALPVVPAAAALPTDGSTPEEAAAAAAATATAIPAAPSVPNPVPLEHIQRQILADKPRVTKFPISWGDEQQQQTAATTNNNAIYNDNNGNGNNNNNNNTAQGEGTAAGTANSTGAAMMAELPMAMAMAAPAMAPPMPLKPPGNMNMNNNNDIDNNNNNNNNNNNMMMQEEDIMEEEELSVDGADEAGDAISMPEESNMSHNSYFGNSDSNGGGGNNIGVQAMAD